MARIAGQKAIFLSSFSTEIDHLDGILALDRMTDIRTMCTREEFERRFRPASPYAMSDHGNGASAADAS
ncbi:MAG: hypothetical protein R2839_13090 [Thermomicrobiales bacterium]